MSAPRVFISYSHEDRAFAQRLVADLQTAGAKVWYDVTGVDEGDFIAKINEALSQCEWFVLVLTPNAIASKWVNKEMNAALHRRDQGFLRGVLPMLAAPCSPGSIPPLWDTLNRYDAVREYAAALAGVLGTLGLRPPSSLPPSRSAPTSTDPALPPLGPAPAPREATPAYHLTPTALYTLGFRGYSRGGVEFVLPPLCPVPGGVFTMGSDKAHDKEADDDETPQYPVDVPAFAIGQHPVTVAEYACAVRAKAVREPEAYTYPQDATWAAAEWRGKKLDWAAQLELLDHPVVGVSCNEGRAYADWLDRITGHPWCLPTEAQWEKAARWDSTRPPNQVARIYPWGDTFDNARCNTDASGIGTTTPVGSYPSGASQCGAQDLAGNVWEWTSSIADSYPYRAEDETWERITGGDRVLRGGSWGDPPTVARVACRRGASLDTRSVAVGFRVVLTAPGS